VESDDLNLNIETAVPCGLILNELVSNACKHAFPDASGGTLRVTISRTKPPGYRLVVHDSGPGFPSDFDIEKSESLGLQLVQTLTYQLKGRLSVTYDSGACISLEFQELNVNKPA